MTWKPIETAPKDGSTFLAVCLEGYIQVVMWDSSGKTCDEEGDVDYYTSEMTDRYVCPTHWMPLPAPPEETET